MVVFEPEITAVWFSNPTIGYSELDRFLSFSVSDVPLVVVCYLTSVAGVRVCLCT